ncbi:benzoylformate decarboxylase [Tardiphaga sp.]|uniref:benzoylformate decarboxylase n=1 Tax=Tardiphaga sp. TaxID=1926292 RepID=UPI00352AE1F6
MNMHQNNRKPASVTVRQATIDLLRALDMTTVFGNPGSTELAFLHDWPDDFRYILALQEASVVGMADGYAQATGRAAFVNLHSAAGVGNALGNIFTAYRNQTPLVITAGQQARSLLNLDPYLGADRATEFPRPYVKWSCEPARAEDVPAAIAEAYYMAMQKPCGPTFVSIPADDWSCPTFPVAPRKVARAFAPDPALLAELAAAINGSERPVFVVGPAIDRDSAFELAVALAERVNAPVWEAPTASRANFPEDHPLFAGFLPAIPEKLSQILEAYDLIVVLGAPVFTFHVPGDANVFRSDVPIYQIVDDASAAARAPSATSILGTMKLSLSALLDLLLPSSRSRTPVRPAPPAVAARDPIPIEFVMQSLSQVVPAETVIVEEAPSHRPAMQRFLPIRQSGGFYTMASGGLGYGLPAAVGIALAKGRRVICLIGDGSAMYSVQALWTAVQQALPLTVVVLNNRGYGAMRAFSKIMQSKYPPGIDVPGIDFTTLAAAFGGEGTRVTRAEDLPNALAASLRHDGPHLVEIIVDPDTGAVY